MSFTVRIEPSGHTFKVEQGETVLEAGLRHGYALPYGCRNGGCGACKGKLLSGELDYGTKLPPALKEQDVQNQLGLFCQARPCSDLVIEAKEIGLPTDLPVKILPTKVMKKEFLADDVVRLFLKVPESERLAFLAGQYIDILLKDGRRRSFSLANAPHDDALLELHIRHVEGGDFTGYVCDTLQEKDILRIEGPHGNFYLREQSKKPIIFMAGGTGFAPIKAIIEHAFAEGLNQAMHLYWGVRDEKDLYLADLPRQWQTHRNNFTFIPVLSSPTSSSDYRKGYVHEAILEDFADGLSEYEVYASGPPDMVYSALDALKAQGLAEEHYYSDAFEYQAPKPATA